MAEPEAPHSEAHEAIHLPPPSIWPVILAVGIALLLTGLVVNPVMLIVGAILCVLSIAVWVREAFRETAELPE